MIVVFVDTNFFLQCKDMKNLSWKEFFQDDEIVIKVPSAVLDEIDRHKQDGNNRRSKRARKASSYFRTVILNGESKTIIKKTDPLVVLSLPPHSDSGIDSQYNLDLSRPDNQIIAEILNYKSSNQHENVVFLTHDTNPILTAKHCGLAVSIIPDEWLLDPELDSRDKKIIELEKKILRLEKTHPEIEIISCLKSGEPTDSILINIITYDALSDKKISDFLSQAQKKYPCVTEFETPKPTNKINHPAHIMLGGTAKYQPPSEERIREYTEEKYPQWLDSIKSYFEKLHTIIEFSTRQSELSFKILNSGSVPAENTIIEFMTVGGLLFFPAISKEELGEEKEIHEFPRPPSPPKGKWVQYNGLFDMINNLQGSNLLSHPGHTMDYPDLSLPFSPIQRDRNVFYWKEGKPIGLEKKWVYECKEFMHQVEPEIFSLNLMVPTNGNPTQGAVKCLVTASNLPAPVRKTLPIKIEYQKGDTEKFANRMFAKHLPLINFGSRNKV